ncbi:MAG TPA: phosphatidylserine decarboxylase family protein [Flavobacteriales bacterium]|nr:phosphatidylserine decarboxylase family protein [Flavobacteriales bacterium]HMR27502.1 phosphatidylserine decarboxylase family protein [Flavobacteriales bacterium]
MGIHREGTATLLLATAVLCFALYGLMQWDSAPAALRIAIAAPLLLVFLIVLWFFRVPRRTVTVDEGAIVSPADGRVVAIEEVHEPEHFNDRRLQVSIFMSPLNVHVNWYPVAGIVSYARYHPGKYLVAWHPKSSTENERSTVVVRHARHGEVLFRQIAGALARRICTYSTAGANADQGREFGFIKFGSRVDVFLPLGSQVKVALGDNVQGSTTVIARFPNA